MPKKKLRTWHVVVGVIVILLGACIWFYRAYFGSAEVALRHAEAFLFRRMAVTQLADQGSYRFFFATNRASENGTADLLDQFNSSRQQALSLGHFDVSIEPNLGLGMLINPTEWFQNEEIQFDDIALQERDAFVASLREQVERSSFKGLLIVVHGFREAFPSALRKTAFVGHVLDINAPVLVFDWPGNQGSTLGGYQRAQQVATDSGDELAAVIRLVLEDVRPERVWLLANSMGAQTVAGAFGQLYQDPELADLEAEIENVVLTAPDVDAAEFDERYEAEIAALARDLTVYVSSNDRALLLSRLVNRSPRRGESTLDPKEFNTAIRFSEMTGPSKGRVTLVDVTPVNRTRNFHNFSLETPEFYDDLFLRLTNRDMPRSRLLYRVLTEDQRVYWVLTRGR